MKEMDAASRKRKMYPNIKHFIKENLYEIKLPKPETVVKGGKIKYKIYKGTEKQIDKIDKQNQSKIEELKQEIEKLKEKKRLEKWFLEKKKKSNKFSKYKKYFKSKTLNLAAFNRNLPKYYRIFNDYKNWRKSFKYPEITYLQKVHNIKPLPPDNLIKDLANSISEIKKLYLGLKDFKAVIIFKLFIHHISQCIKAKCKIKYHSKGYNWGGSVSPVERDIDEIGNLITEFYLNIKDADDDPNTKEFSCLCGKLKGKKNIGVLCKNKECHTEVSACQPKPWNSAPNFVSIKAKEKYIDGKDYKKYLREYKRLLKIKNKNQIQTKKYVFGKGTYKVSVVEDLADNFFKLTYHLDDEKLNFIFNQIPNKIDKKFDDKRIILNKSDKDLELYWGEIKNNKPNGKGVSEKYETDEFIKKVFNKVGLMWWKMYSKNLKAKDLKGYIISEKYEGKWKEGKKHGKGVLTIFIDPSYASNKNNTPKIQNEYRGNFIDNLLDGEIKEYDDIENEWTTYNYKMGKKMSSK